MSHSHDDTIADQIADECERDHTERHDDCQHCHIRSAQRFCGQCGATFEDGRWYDRTDPDCAHTVGTLDGYGTEVVCQWPTATGRYSPCGDGIETAGADYCDFHQREADALAADQRYRRLVAVR